ncbi:MAG: biotin/lipoyl-containing protein, partial [Brevundimonas sp.]
MTDILMPALSPTMEEGVLAKWHVKVGDTVKAGDVIAEIETDKATMEVEAVDEGEIAEILVAEGSEGVKVNTLIARLAGEDGTAAPAARSPEAPKSGVSKPAESVVPAASTPTAVASTGSGERVFASPLARRLAKEAGLDLKSIKGTGPRGRIVRSDVDAAGKGAPAVSAPTAVSSSTAEPRKVQSLAQMGIPDGSYDLVPLDGMRKAIARRLTDSFRD